MTVLSAQTIRKLNLIKPFCERTLHEQSGTTFGLSGAGYDIRLDQSVILPSKGCRLASSIEYFHMPNDVVGKLYNKSTWVRKFLVNPATILEPGWDGFLTLELINPGPNDFFLKEGTPIAQIVFEFLDEPTEQPYGNGKYQNQPREPVGAR